MTASAHDVRRYGRHALLVTPRAGTSPLALAHAIRSARPPGTLDVVPAAETVLITFDSELEAATIIAAMGLFDGSPVDDRDAEIGGDAVVIDVEYDGEDLDDVAAATGLSTDEVVRRHCAPTYHAAFCGFAPGFAYLTGLDPALVLPRRDTPRTTVPAGSVAIADRYTAVYPTGSPGGWHLIGRTDAVLWDERRDDPATLRPGTHVRFRPVRGASHTSRTSAASNPPPRPHVDDGVLEVIAAGWSTSVQDAGRPGFAHLGVSPSGAIDESRRLALNRLLGNPPEAAVVETTGGLGVRALRAVVVADSTSGAVTTLGPGDELRIDPRRGELWATFAVRGGVAAAPVLGSRSWDSLAHIGPPPPTVGTVLAAGDDPRTSIDAVLAPPEPASARVALLPGPRRDWFGDDAWTALIGASWQVADAVSRVGMRLVGPRLERVAERRGSELASEGLVRGAVQVPPDGQPVVLLADHPTTGGYPVVAVVDDRAVDGLARLGPGSTVRFAAATI